ncbi:transposase [Candidatus Brocadia sp. AMX2]|uniref:transposase n=1 Tax=Candidatus Brocadia sp. AMX2 TaxID=2293635 RepID=UPI00403E2740
MTSAISEGINNKIKRLKRMAYGYRDVKYFLRHLFNAGRFNSFKCTDIKKLAFEFKYGIIFCHNLQLRIILVKEQAEPYFDIDNVPSQKVFSVDNFFLHHYHFQNDFIRQYEAA